MRLLLLHANTQECIQCIRVMKSIPELTGVLAIVPINSEEIKSIISTSTNIRVTNVPSILQMNEDTGEINVFDGFDSAREFVTEIMNNLKKPVEPEIEQPPEPVPEPVPTHTSIKDLGLSSESLDTPQQAPDKPKKMTADDLQKERENLEKIVENNAPRYNTKR